LESVVPVTITKKAPSGGPPPSGLTIGTFLAKVAVPEEHVEWCLDNGIVMSLTATGVSFDLGNGKTYLVAIPLGTISQIAAQMAPLSDAAKVHDQIMKTIELLQKQKEAGVEFGIESAAQLSEALTSSPSAGFVMAKKTVTNVSEAIKQKGLHAPTGELAKAAEPTSLGWPVFDVSKMTLAPKIRLADADKMYQPVDGTSGGSRYFVIAGRHNLKVAARYTGQSLSLRVEGSGLMTWANRLKILGFSTHSAKGYASMHVQVDNDIMASKVMGAILVALEAGFETPLPVLDIISGKGA
jgi:hypothetical protein